jgi:predicted NodU family carbamoyl transferase
VAAAFQLRLEESLLSLARTLRQRTREDYLVISGGVSLNSVANGRLVRESGFRDVYVMPAAGDNGTAIGAAFYLWNHVLGKPRSLVHLDPYVGDGYSQSAVLAAIAECKLTAQKLADVETEAASYTRERSWAGSKVGWRSGHAPWAIEASWPIPRSNPRFHRLLKEFEALSGAPVLLNTSFNVMGEPIVASPIDAIRCFFSTGLDALVIDDFLLTK